MCMLIGGAGHNPSLSEQFRCIVRVKVGASSLQLH